MGILSILLLVVFVICSLLLIVLVLIQDEQGEGLGGLFGGGSTTPFGARSGNVLTKFTSVLAGIFLVCSFALAWINKTPETGDVLGASRRGAAQEQTVDEWWVVEPELSATEDSEESSTQADQSSDN
ncbi:MAG: preprotein translocase subunit SecG [Spirochaetales bacterium]|jgi:preprotein translocase subunit SecG|nr:preprotein translocase subunit SecG [Spirochaetales bacterium]